MKELAGLKVRCRSCGAANLYETSDKYDPDKPLTGDMLRLQSPYSSFNWGVYDGFPAADFTTRFMMLCTKCGGYLALSGKLNFVDKALAEQKIRAVRAFREYEKYNPDVPDIPAEKFVCPVCGKECKTKAGLSNHMRLTKKKGKEK